MEVPALTPSRMPRSEGEDTVSVILFPGDGDEGSNKTDNSKGCGWRLLSNLQLR